MSVYFHSPPAAKERLSCPLIRGLIPLPESGESFCEAKPTTPAFIWYLKKRRAEAVLAGEDGTRLDVDAGLAVVDLPGGEAGGIPELLLIEGIGCAGLNLVFPEAEAGIERQVGIEVAGGRIEAVVDNVVGAAPSPSRG
jgi:hypothetical protein